MTRTALVTGAGRGIGRATAVALARRGFQVALTARTGAQLAETAAAVRALGPAALVVAGDVAAPGHAEACVERATAELGGLDLLVHSAGIFRTAPLLENDDALWDEVLATNLTGAFRFTRAAVRQMWAQDRGGMVIHISSVAGRKGFPGSGAYCASKFGLIGLAEAVREELRGSGIRVVVVCPGQVDTTAWDTCGLDLEAIGIRRDAMMSADAVGECIAAAADGDGIAVPEEIVLRPPCGD